MPNKPPAGPKGHWLWGSMDDINNHIFEFMDTLRDYDEVVSLRFGPFPALVAQSPEAVREVLVTKAAVFYKPQTMKNALKDISGENIFSSDGEFWKRQRKLMQPAFHTKRIGAYADTMVQKAQQAVAAWHDQDEIDVEKAMKDVTMHIITATMFNTDIGAKSRDLGEQFVTLFDVINRRMMKLIQLPAWLPTADNRAAHQARDALNATLREIIRNRRESLEDTGDLLSMLMLAEDENGEGMSDEQILNELITIFAAGHETTATTLTWALWLIAEHSDVEARLLQEIDTVLGDRPATLEDLSKLKYTGQVIKEVLRLYPAAYITTRQANEDTEILGYEVSKGTVVMVPIWGIHRNAKYFDEPTAFKPERWTEEFESTLPRYAYLPFGAGPRICIGNGFATMEAQLVLVTILQHFTMTAPDDLVAEPMRRFTLATKYGMRLIAHARSEKPIAEPAQ